MSNVPATGSPPEHCPSGSKMFTYDENSKHPEDTGLQTVQVRIRALSISWASLSSRGLCFCLSSILANKSWTLTQLANFVSRT